MAEIRGIDVSTFNTVTDWKKVQEAGIQFVIIRAGFGNTAEQQDAKFKSHMEGALKAGLCVGVYWFSYARSVQEAVQEAQACLQVIQPYQDQILYPVFFDFEYDSEEYAKKSGITVDKRFVTDVTKAFCAEIQKAGYTPGWYTNQDYYKNKLYPAELKEYHFWLADYTAGPAYECAIQQYTSTGQVNGISGNVDMNVAFWEYGESDKPVMVPPSPSPTDTTVDVTYRVRGKKGVWYPAVKNLKDYAGVAGDAITDVAIKVSKGKVKYRVHILGGDWLPYVTGYDINNVKNGYAGNKKPIDAIEVYYYTPDGIQPYKKAKYRVSPLNGNYWPWQYDNEKDDSQDGYAGSFGQQLDRFQIVIE